MLPGVPAEVHICLLMQSQPRNDTNHSMCGCLVHPKHIDMLTYTVVPLAQIDVPMQVILATHENTQLKPNTGMWEFLKENCNACIEPGDYSLKPCFTWLMY